MDLAITTTQIDASVAMQAYRLYKDGKYSEAIPVLQQILDFEPRNWHARLFLSASYFKTNQPMAAERGFRAVFENCPEEELKQKACFALQSVAAATAKIIQVPAEFGTVVERTVAPFRPIETIIT